MICIGPCCIPASALLPLLLLLLSPVLRLLRKTPLAKYLPDPDARIRGRASTMKRCCDTSSCQDGEGSTTGNVKTVESLEHWVNLKRSESLLVVDFTANWCKPCSKMAPIFESLAIDYGKSATFAKVDIDHVPEAFEGTRIPAFHVLRRGAKVDSVTGTAEDKLRKMIAQACKKTS